MKATIENRPILLLLINAYMQKIYPDDTRDALQVFQLYEAQGEYFDISNPSRIVRESIVIGEAFLKNQ